MIDARTAREISRQESYWDDTHTEIYLQGDTLEYQVLVLTSFLKQLIPSIIVRFAEQKKTRAYFEPFLSIPSPYHPQEVEDAVMEKLVDWLADHLDYKNVHSDRLEGRVVLTFDW